MQGSVIETPNLLGPHALLPIRVSRWGSATCGLLKDGTLAPFPRKGLKFSNRSSCLFLLPPKAAQDPALTSQNLLFCRAPRNSRSGSL